MHHYSANCCSSETEGAHNNGVKHPMLPQVGVGSGNEGGGGVQLRRGSARLRGHPDLLRGFLHKAGTQGSAPGEPVNIDIRVQIAVYFWVLIDVGPVEAFAPGQAIPTTENLAAFILETVGALLPDGVRVHQVRVHEDRDLWSDVFGDDHGNG